MVETRTASLSRYGTDVSSVFDLVGHHEVDLTAALGWTLHCSPLLRRALLEELGFVTGGDVDVLLEVADAEGRTDVELVGSNTKIVIEAKRGWLVPGESQLGQYAGRFVGFQHALLVSLSDSSTQWAHAQLADKVGDVPVVHVPWDLLRTLVHRSRIHARGTQRLWLDEWETYMGGMTSTRDLADQWVFCVVVSRRQFGRHTFWQWVHDERVYFHPYGGSNGWPKRPPNFLCFRWGGQVRQVNRVTSFEVVPQLGHRWPEISDEMSGGAHIIYELGPDIPIPQIRTTKTYASGRIWTLLDQLLVHDTLNSAVAASKAITQG
ncbi:hypothetical protein [Flexivirga sp. B27]